MTEQNKLTRAFFLQAPGIDIHAPPPHFQVNNYGNLGMLGHSSSGQLASECHRAPLGVRFIQFGDWRLGAANAQHLTLSSPGFQPPPVRLPPWVGGSEVQPREGKKTAQIWRYDGNTFPANGRAWDHSWGLWGWQLLAGKFLNGDEEDSRNIAFGDRFIQIQDFRLGDIDGFHFSVSHAWGQVAAIYTGDGRVHLGPRTDWSLWHRPITVPRDIRFGGNFVQIGNFRLGQSPHDSNTFVIVHSSGNICIKFTARGYVHYGPIMESMHNLYTKPLCNSPL